MGIFLITNTNVHVEFWRASILIQTLPSPQASLFPTPKAFRVTWSWRKCERSLRIRHRSELTERDWENAVKVLGKFKRTQGVCP